MIIKIRTSVAIEMVAESAFPWHANEIKIAVVSDDPSSPIKSMIEELGLLDTFINPDQTEHDLVIDSPEGKSLHYGLLGDYPYEDSENKALSEEVDLIIVEGYPLMDYYDLDPSTMYNILPSSAHIIIIED